MLQHVASQKLTDISEMFTASTIRAMMTDEISTSKTVNFDNTTQCNILKDGHILFYVIYIAIFFQTAIFTT
jgi:hypothetical protein